MQAVMESLVDPEVRRKLAFEAIEARIEDYLEGQRRKHTTAEKRAHREKYAHSY